MQLFSLLTPDFTEENQAFEDIVMIDARGGKPWSSHAAGPLQPRPIPDDELHERFLADVPSIPIYNGLDVDAFRSNVRATPWAGKKPRAREVEKN